MDRELRAARQRELSQTAFGDAVDIPRDFVAPVSASARDHARTDARAQSKLKTRKKAGAVQSSAYSKRAMAATASSAAKAAAPSSSNNSSNATPHRKRSGAAATASRVSTAKKKPDVATSHHTRAAEPVDFVYDIGVRRKLREEIDSERTKTLQDAAAKEAQLRAAHKWVHDRAGAARPDRTLAWGSSERHATQSRPARDATGADAKPARASSAASSRSSCARSSRSPLPAKSSIAPNVSEWRTQAFPAFASRDAAIAERRRVEQQRQEQQWRDAKDVRDTIDVFESRMHELAI